MKKQNTESFFELLDWLSNNPDIVSGKSSCKLLDTISELIKHLRECAEYSNCFGRSIGGVTQVNEDEDTDFLEDDFLAEDDEISGDEGLDASDRNNKKKKKRTKKG